MDYALDNIIENLTFTKKFKTETISLGSKSLNRMLNGGVKTGFVTDFFGASNTGKTQICFQLCVTVQLLDEEGGAVFVDSLGTFRPERIREIAQHMKLKEDIFERIMVVKARSVREQIDVPKRLKVAPFNVRLLIIDTLTDNFIFEYQGEERAIVRQSNLAKHLHDLCSLALRDGVAVVVTNTVRSRIKDDRYHEVETGGNVASQGVHIRVHLSKEPRGMSARLVQPPIDRATAYFKINSVGIVDNGWYR
ncbi:MAG: DNA repair and recombination protein RadA [archaeon]|nr:DNA repair and recombination protein RadA [archaeon]MCP8305491.1 DNA repair and recombination protein RadA [archaeon]